MEVWDCVRDLVRMNDACIVKLWSSLKRGTTGLWVEVLQGKYGRGQLENGSVVAKTDDSVLWKNIVCWWDHIQDYEFWALGDGGQLIFWYDAWIAPSYKVCHIGGPLAG